MKYTGTSTRAKPQGRVAMDFSCYVFYITTTRVILTRKELYDFYYTLVTLTMGYKVTLYITILN